MFVAFVAMSLCFSSCHKDGQYKPKEKISKIYRAISDGEKVLSQEWVWDGKQLAKANHYYYDEYEGSLNLSWVEQFTYGDKNRIERIEDVDHKEYIQYNYDGNKLAGFEYYYNGIKELTAVVEYDGKKISKITYTYIDYKKSANESKKFNFLPKNFEKHIVAKDADETIVVTLNLEWDKDNVTKAVYAQTYTNRSYIEDYSYELTYTYDDKINPRYGNWNMYSFIFEEEIDVNAFSKNNVTSATSILNYKEIDDGETYTDQEKEVSNYTITYDGKYPVSIKEEDPEYTNWSYTIFYEYEE